MHNTIPALMAGCLISTGQAAEPAKQPARICDAETFKQFDFWVGTWDVRTADGKLAGRNTITLEEQGCVVHENWRNTAGSTGQSFNYYDPVVAKWKQRWVGLGIILEMEGGMQGDAMLLEGPLHYVQQKKTTLLRGRWSKLPDGRVRQQFHESPDGGKTWTEWFDGYYTRA